MSSATKTATSIRSRGDTAYITHRSPTHYAHDPYITPYTLRTCPAHYAHEPCSPTVHYAQRPYTLRRGALRSAGALRTGAICTEHRSPMHPTHTSPANSSVTMKTTSIRAPRPPPFAAAGSEPYDLQRQDDEHLHWQPQANRPHHAHKPQSPHTHTNTHKPHMHTQILEQYETRQKAAVP